MPVLFDPDGVFPATFGVAVHEVNAVLTRGAVISWIDHYAADEVRAEIEAARAR